MYKGLGTCRQKEVWIAILTLAFAFAFTFAATSQFGQLPHSFPFRTPPASPQFLESALYASSLIKWKILRRRASRLNQLFSAASLINY